MIDCGPEGIEREKDEESCGLLVKKAFELERKGVSSSWLALRLYTTAPLARRHVVISRRPSRA